MKLTDLTLLFAFCPLTINGSDDNLLFKLQSLKQCGILIVQAKVSIERLDKCSPAKES